MGKQIEGEKLKSILAAYRVNVSEFAQAWGVGRSALYNRLFKRTLTTEEINRSISILRDHFNLSEESLNEAFQITPTAQLRPSPTLQNSIDALTEAVNRLTEVLSQK